MKLRQNHAIGQANGNAPRYAALFRRAALVPRLSAPRASRDKEEEVVTQTRFINPPGLSKPPGYTHVVEATAPARLVYIAGQLGVDSDGKVGSSDFRLQAVQTFEN